MTPHLALALLVTVCVSLGTLVDNRLRPSDGTDAKDLASRFMGEGRKVFSDQFFTRSDVYFHSGYYPSIFDRAEMKENHLAQGASAEEPGHAEAAEEHHDHHEAGEHHEGSEEHHQHNEKCGHEAGFLGKPTDFMDAFRRHFMVAEHTHLADKGPNAQREILPWLKLAAKLDPSKIESYTVASFWLRDMGRKEEAEQCIREGLRHNPNSFELLFEMGRCYYERDDLDRARNLWENGIRRWNQQERLKPTDKQNNVSAGQLLNYLARLEASVGHKERAIEWLTQLKDISPQPDQVEKRIQEARLGLLRAAK